jgi:hypothetical protein
LRRRNVEGIVALMNEIGKVLVILGAALVIIGALMWKTNLLGWVGRLPGDIHITGKSGSFHFPFVTCLLISVMISLIAWLLRR